MIGNPYYEMLSMLPQRGVSLAFASPVEAEKDIFEVEGRRVRLAGRAAGVTAEAENAGERFLCAGGPEGWFLLCRLEEQ